MDYEKIVLEWKGFDVPDVVDRDYDINLKYDLVTTISGPRRAGKTYFCFQIMKKLMCKNVNILYINFEDEKLIGANEKDLSGLFEKYLEIFEVEDGEKIYLFFDEIQNVVNWSNWVRRVYDTKKNVKIVLTGSSSKMLSKEISTSLRGRVYNIEMFPFSFREYLKFVGVEFGSKVSRYKNMAKIKSVFRNYLVNGGYPFLIVNSDVPRTEILQGYYNSMIFQDVVERYKISDVKKLQLLAKLVFESTSKEISYSKLSNKMKSIGFDISRNTVQEYVSYFEEAYLFFQVLKFEYSLSRQLGSIKKVYCVDNGMLNSISFKYLKDYGKLLENVVFLELKRRKSKVYYNREKYECDFLLQSRNKIVGVIQVCYKIDEENREREVKGLVEALKKFRLKEGIIITYEQNDEFVVEGKKIKVLKVCDWLLE